MSYICINGYKLPPCKRGVKEITSTMVNAARDANGVTVGQKIGHDVYKFDTLEWPWLTADEWHHILSILNNFYVNVTFHDFVTGDVVTRVMYCNDRSAEPYWVTPEGKPTHYRNCKFHLIDTGL